MNTVTSIRTGVRPTTLTNGKRTIEAEISGKRLSLYVYHNDEICFMGHYPNSLYGATLLANDANRFGCFADIEMDQLPAISSLVPTFGLAEPEAHIILP